MKSTAVVAIKVISNSERPYFESWRPKGVIGASSLADAKLYIKDSLLLENVLKSFDARNMEYKLVEVGEIDSTEQGINA